MAYTATHKHARISARKVRSMANLIRGKHADEARFVTGQVLGVDGGIVMGS